MEHKMGELRVLKDMSRSVTTILFAVVLLFGLERTGESNLAESEGLSDIDGNTPDNVCWYDGTAFRMVHL